MISLTSAKHLTVCDMLSSLLSLKHLVSQEHSYLVGRLSLRCIENKEMLLLELFLNDFISMILYMTMDQIFDCSQMVLVSLSLKTIL